MYVYVVYITPLHRGTVPVYCTGQTPPIHNLNIHILSCLFAPCWLACLFYFEYTAGLNKKK